MVLPRVISHLPQDATENGTTTHALGNVLFGFEAKGEHRGADLTQRMCVRTFPSER